VTSLTKTTDDMDRSSTRITGSNPNGRTKYAPVILHSASPTKIKSLVIGLFPVKKPYRMSKMITNSETERILKPNLLQVTYSPVYERRLAEEYYWAITLMHRPISAAIVLEFVLELDSLLYTHIVDQMHTQFRLAPDIPRRKHCIYWWGWGWGGVLVPI
jgi:hypothetical protein